MILDNSALAASGAEARFDGDAWPDVHGEVIRPLLQSMRDVRRYGLAVSHALRGIGAEVAVVDVLGLEAIRVFLPDVFALLGASVDGLTKVRDGWSSRDEPKYLKEQVDRLVAAAKDDGAVIRSMVTLLFPGAARHVGGSSYGAEWTGGWLKKRRVAHADVLRYYLERTASSGLSAHSAAERAFGLLADEGALDTYLRSLPEDQQEDVISGLETFEDEFRPEHVVPATTVLLNMLTSLPERPRQLFGFNTRLSVTRVTLRLVRSLKEPQAIADAVRAILPRLNSLTARAELVSDVGHVEREGHKLVDEAEAVILERELRAQIRSAGADALAAEKDVMWLVLVAKRRVVKGEPPFELPESPELTAALLAAARSETLSNVIGSRAVKRSYRLQWDALIEVFGTEDELKRRIAAVPVEIRSTLPEQFSLADRYVAGWRPKRDDE